jgi:dTMP kinase
MREWRDTGRSFPVISMTGKLIVIEAGDGCGKQTQTKKLFERLVLENLRVKKVEYPNYKSEASALIKMYLRGDFDSDPEAVNPYAAASFYAVDRYASFKTGWEDFYETGGIVVADRYTTSNMVHQAVKIKDIGERTKYLDWLWELEFTLFKMPIPDLVLFLDIPPQYSLKLITDRAEKNIENKKDIHESDARYLADCYNNYQWLAKRYDWQVINCVDDSGLKDINTIHNEIFSAVELILAK